MLNPSSLLIAAALWYGLPADGQAQCAQSAASVALSVPDIDRARDFYAAGLQMQLASEREFIDHGLRMALLCSAQLNLELLESSQAEPASTTTMQRHLRHGLSKFGVRVDSIEKFSERLLRLGASELVAPFDEAELGLRIAVLADPFGNPLQLSEALSNPR